MDLASSLPAIGIGFTWYKEWPPEHSLDHTVRYASLGGYPKDLERLTELGILGRAE